VNEHLVGRIEFQRLAMIANAPSLPAACRVVQRRGPCTYTDNELNVVIDNMLPEALLDRIGATRDRDLVLRLTRICDELQRLTLNDALEETVDAEIPSIDTQVCYDPTSLSHRYGDGSRFHPDNTRKETS
jgi:hypothetical protein